MRPQQNPKKNDDAERVHNFAPPTNLTKAKAASRLFELVTAGTSLLFFFFLSGFPYLPSCYSPYTLAASAGCVGGGFGFDAPSSIYVSMIGLRLV